jgi:hypothetical protein
MQNLKRTLLAGSLLLGAGIVCADVPRQEHVWRLGPSQGLDTPVGRVWFDVQRTEAGKVYVVPMQQVRLMLREVTAPRDMNLALGLTRCEVIKRALVISAGSATEDPVAMNMTIVRCGPREFVAEEVLFTTEEASK